MTKSRSFSDYVDSVLICKYFSALRETEEAQNENDRKIKRKYPETVRPKKGGKSNAITANKVFRALRDYKTGAFEIGDIKNIEILFVDHALSRFNLQKHSFPKDATYCISNDEKKMIEALRESIKLTEENEDDIIEVVHSEDWQRIQQKMEFKSGKDSIIGLHSIFTFQDKDKMVFAATKKHQWMYFLFVFRWFSIIIHEKLERGGHLESRAIQSRYMDIFKQLNQSGL